MSILNESQQFGKKILSWLWIFITVFVFFFGFGIKNGIPRPSYDSTSALFFKKIQQDLLIKEIELITINPLDALWAQIGISLFLAFIITFPILFYKIASFFSSALRPKEKRAILKAFIPSVILFIFGCVFAYYFLIPAIFKFLYHYVLAIGAKPFFEISQFVSLVLTLTLVVGILFLIPVFMVLLTRLGIVGSDIWKNNWHYAILIFLILAAIITPDGTGITMILLALPLITLYGIGYLGSRKLNNPNNSNISEHHEYLKFGDKFVV